MGALNWNPELTRQNQRLFMQEQDKGKAANDSDGNKPQFKLVPIKHLIDNPKPLKWAIKGILEQGGMNLMAGAYGCGKSFVAFDMAFCCAAGIDWHDHKVIQTPVIILAGEGHSGIADRFAALAIQYGVDCPDGLYVSEIPAQLTDCDNAEWVGEAVNQICAEAGMVIVDTLNRNFGGLDENSTKDMTAFVSNVDAVFRTTGKTVVVVHHAGHNGDRSRGSIVLPGSCEAEFFIKKQNNGLVLKCTKQKNAPESEPLYFKFKTVALHGRFDDEGAAVSSLCLELTNDIGIKTKDKDKKLTVRETQILTSLERAIASNGINPPTDIMEAFNLSDGQKIVHIDHWRHEAYQSVTVDVSDDSNKADALKKAFYRGREKLFKDGLIIEHGDYVWIVS